MAELSTLGSVIKTAYEGESDTNAFTDAEKSKLSGIEASADVTDATNVAAAGAIMDGDFSSNGMMARTASGTYASRTITAGTLATVSNGNGQSGNPTVGLADVATETVIGRVAASTGAPKALSKAELTTLVNTFTTSLSGAVPAASGGNTTTEFLRKDGTWAVPPGTGGGSGVVEVIVPGGGIAVDNTDPANPVVSIDPGSGLSDIGALANGDKFIVFDASDGDAAGTVSGLVQSRTSGVTGADPIINIISLTTAEFGAITPDSSTVYLITDAT